MESYEPCRHSDVVTVCNACMIARLTAERDAALTTIAYKDQGLFDVVSNQTQLRNERDEAKAVAVWAAKHRAFVESYMTGSSNLRTDVVAAGKRIRIDGINAAEVFRALVEACEGGRDHG